jgi:hypothetical protein
VDLDLAPTLMNNPPPNDGVALALALGAASAGAAEALAG